MNKYEEVILEEIRKNEPINVKGLRRIVCDNQKYKNRMGTPTLEKYLKRLHEDGYTSIREIKNQKLYSVIKDTGFSYEQFYKTLNGVYYGYEEIIEKVLRRVDNDTYDKKLRIHYNVIDLLFAYQNFLKIANVMSKNKLTSNSYIEIEKKIEKLITNVANRLERNATPLVLKNFERNVREPSEQINKYLQLNSMKKLLSSK